jgi:putative transposase
MPEWPHSPVHRLSDAGAYMVTASTYGQALFLLGKRRLALVRDTLLEQAAALGWNLQAWAVLPNHYHFVATSEEPLDTLPALIKRLHSLTARAVNAEDGTPGRRVWFQY